MTEPTEKNIHVAEKKHRPTVSQINPTMGTGMLTGETVPGMSLAE
ncbi:hypothetical protein [Thermogutta sp.]|nr:hypothetical protein [Thermogutta sp.]